MTKEAKKKTPQTTNNGAKGKLSHYKSRPEKKRYTRAERERIAATRAVFEILDKDSEAKQPEISQSNDSIKGRLSHYKSRPEKKRYTKEERELIAIWRGLFEAMDRQEQTSE